MKFFQKPTHINDALCHYKVTKKQCGRPIYQTICCQKRTTKWGRRLHDKL